MKIFILLSILILSACSKQATTDGGLGEVGPLNPQPVSIDDQAKMNIICNAVNYKSTILENESRDFVFDYSQRGCGETKVTTGQVVTKVADTRASDGTNIYAFVPQDGKAYVFKEIETSSTGILRKICDSLQDPANPPVNPFLTDTTGTKALAWYMTNSDECSSNNDNYCVSLVYASSADQGASFYKHTRELLKIRVTAGVNRGYFIMREKTSQIGCAKDKDATYTTVLK